MTISTEIREAFAALIGAENVITEEKLALRNLGYCAENYDGGLLLTPASTQQVAAICTLAAKKDVAIVPQGGLTGLVEGTATAQGQVALSLEKMNRILSVDPAQSVIIAEAGATLQALIEAAAEHGMMPGVDLPSRGSCTIGGMTATNAGGIQAIRYGMMRENVLGLEVVLAGGTVLDLMNELVKNNAGYDLKQAFIGSEGTLGIITRVVLRLHAKPIKTHTALLGCADTDKLLNLLMRSRARFGGSLLSFEVMWPEYFKLTSQQPGAQNNLIGSEHAVYVVIEAGEWSSPYDDDVFDDFLEEILETELVSDGVLAQSDTQRVAIWRLREDSDAVESVHNSCLSYDIGLKLKDIPYYADRLQNRLRKDCPGISGYVFGHLADGNLHVVTGPAEPDGPGNHAAVDAVVYGVLAEFQGTTVSAEHGIGHEKRTALAGSRAPEVLDAMRALKAAFDPQNRLNPGKIF